MWTRGELKYSAKEVLRTNYWSAFVAVIICGAITIAASLPFSIASTIPQITDMMEKIQSGENLAGYTATQGSPISYLSILVSIFLTFPLMVGLMRYFLNIRENRSEYSSIFMSFKNGNYLKVVGAMAWQYLFTVLWTLLLIVPGIIKGISYSMVPYILAENPKIGYKRAIKLSMAMTEGHKGDMFVLYLSFIGWYLLSLLACCGIGLIFLMPYTYSTYAELYVKLRTIAIERNICTPDELNLVAITPEQPQNNF